MKKILSIVLFLSFVLSVNAQEVSDGLKKEKFRKIQLDLFSDVWEGLPPTVAFKDYNPGVNLYYSYPIEINKNVGFAVGGGFSWHNLYSNGLPMEMTDSVTGLYSGTEFVRLPYGTSYKKNKIRLSYFDIPVEFRIKTYEPKKFRFAIGGKIGILTKAITKYKGSELTGDFAAFNGKQDINHLNMLRYGVSARIGYGIINLYAYYQLSEVFEHQASPTMYPLSFGISLLVY
jgi:hypothetical protein